MDYLCLKCGHINFKAEANVCENCSYERDLEKYHKLAEHAKRAVRYGYRYRIAYEDQVRALGEVRQKYSLLNPESYLELLAQAILVGTAYDIVKHVAKQIYLRLNNKQKQEGLTFEEQSVINLLNDSRSFSQFIVYVISYYKGMPNVDEKIRKAIFDEEINRLTVNVITDERKMKKLKDEVENGEDFNTAFFNLLMVEARKEVNQGPKKPNLNELDDALKGLKKQLKQVKKEGKRKGK